MIHTRKQLKMCKMRLNDKLLFIGSIPLLMRSCLLTFLLHLVQYFICRHFLSKVYTNKDCSSLQHRFRPRIVSTNDSRKGREIWKIGIYWIAKMKPHRLAEHISWGLHISWMARFAEEEEANSTMPGIKHFYDFHMIFGRFDNPCKSQSGNLGWNSARTKQWT